MTDKLGAILHDKVEKGGDAFVEKMDLVSKLSGYATVARSEERTPIIPRTRR